MVETEMIRSTTNGLGSPGTAGLLLLSALVSLSAVSAVRAQEGKTSPAMHGYCPASYLLTGKAVKGDPKLAVTHNGKVYHLANADAKAKFEADPGQYLPQFDGFCAASLGGIKSMRNEPDPTVFEIVDGKVYLFVSQRHRKVFVSQTKKFLSKATERFVAVAGYCPVAYQVSNKAIKGDERFSVIRKGYEFHMASEKGKEAFRKDPDKYTPRYRMNCAYGISGNKRFPVDPTVFSVVDGKTYLFFDQPSKASFDAAAQELIEKADENWKVLKDMQ